MNKEVTKCGNLRSKRHFSASFYRAVKVMALRGLAIGFLMLGWGNLSERAFATEQKEAVLLLTGVKFPMEELQKFAQMNMKEKVLYANKKGVIVLFLGGSTDLKYPGKANELLVQDSLVAATNYYTRLNLVGDSFSGLYIAKFDVNGGAERPFKDQDLILLPKNANGSILVHEFAHYLIATLRGRETGKSYEHERVEDLKKIELESQSMVQKFVGLQSVTPLPKTKLDRTTNKLIKLMAKLVQAESRFLQMREAEEVDVTWLTYNFTNIFLPKEEKREQDWQDLKYHRINLSKVSEYWSSIISPNLSQIYKVVAYRRKIDLLDDKVLLKQIETFSEELNRFFAHGSQFYSSWAQSEMKKWDGQETLK